MRAGAERKHRGHRASVFGRGQQGADNDHKCCSTERVERTSVERQSDRGFHRVGRNDESGAAQIGRDRRRSGDGDRQRREPRDMLRAHGREHVRRQSVGEEVRHRDHRRVAVRRRTTGRRPASVGAFARRSRVLRQWRQRPWTSAPNSRGRMRPAPRGSSRGGQSQIGGVPSRHRRPARSGPRTCQFLWCGRPCGAPAPSRRRCR